MVPTHARERKDSFPKPHSTETPTMTAPELDDRIETKMRSAGVPTPTITAFLNALHKVARINAKTFEPLSWPAQPELEWCPPGHGDFYPALLGSGLLDGLLRRGVKFLFISNSDNLGATIDLKLLRYFAQSGLSFLMEVAERTASDRKGGHLASRRTSGRLLLRESAQCPKADEGHFQNIERHRFF